jgi:hypothetical protein
MAQGIFTLKQQLQGVKEKSWNNPVGTYAASFNGSNQYLTVANNANLQPGSGAWTVEFWAYPTATTVMEPYSKGPNFQIYTYGITWSAYLVNSSSGLILNASFGNLTANTWQHIAVVFTGSAYYGYLNGVQTLLATSSTLVDIGSNGVTIGAYSSGASAPFAGSISNVRWVKGTAVYTSNFTPTITPLTAITNTQLLTLQNDTIIDKSNNAFVITNNGSVTTSIAYPFNGLQTPAVDYLVVAGGGSGKYDGYGGGGAGGLLQGSVPVTTGSAITVTIGAGGAGYPGSSGQNSVFGNITAFGGAYAIQYGPLTGGSGAGPFNWTGTGSQQQSFSTYGQGNDGGQPLLTSPSGSGGGGAGTKGLTGTSAGGGSGGAGIASAISGTVTTYAGGGGGGAYGVATNASGGVGGGGIGNSSGGSSGTSGQINTGGGGGAGNNAGGSGIVIISYPDIYAGAAATTGSPTVSTSGSGSLLPGSTSSWIYYAAQSGFAFGTGDFTIEFWVNFTSTTSGASGTSYLFDFRGANYSSSNSALGIYQNNGGMFLFSQSGIYINAGMPLTNTWLNVSVSRVSGTMYYFVNGNLIGSGADSTNYTVASAGPSFMGSGYYNNYGLQGYMSNIRVIKGTGLYTSNYPVITTPYTAVTNTQLLLNTVSGAYLADGSTNAYTASVTGTVNWNQASPIATGLGYKNRVYKYIDSGTITF